MSEVKTDKLSPRTDSGTTTLGDSGDTFLVNTGAKLDLNGTELILDANANTSITADTDDQIDIRIAGADDFRFTANTFTALAGSTIAAQALTATSLTGLTTPLTVAQGGSGAATHTANGVLLGAGTGAVTTAAPGASGQVLTSNGTVWASAAAAAGVILYSSTDTAYITTTSTGYVDTGSYITFTPASASSKLLVTVTSLFGGETTYQEANMHNYWQIQDSTNAVQVTFLSNHIGSGNAGNESESFAYMWPGSMQAVYDSPGTSAITLKARAKSSHSSYYTTFFGGGNNSINVWTVLEI